MSTLQLIEEAFRHRRMPTLFSVSEQLDEHEVEDVMSFWGQPWTAMTAAQLQEHFEALFWFTPEAFCYYLPGIMTVGIKETMSGLIVNHSLISMLDRSPDPESWDDFFIARWPLLTAAECEATQAWVLWLSSFEDTSYFDNSFDRAIDTLELLRRRRQRSGV